MLRGAASPTEIFLLPHEVSQVTSVSQGLGGAPWAPAARSFVGLRCVCLGRDPRRSHCSSAEPLSAAPSALPLTQTKLSCRAVLICNHFHTEVFPRTLSPYPRWPFYKIVQPFCRLPPFPGPFSLLFLAPSPTSAPPAPAGRAQALLRLKPKFMSLEGPRALLWSVNTSALHTLAEWTKMNMCDSASAQLDASHGGILASSPPGPKWEIKGG